MQQNIAIFHKDFPCTIKNACDTIQANAQHARDKNIKGDKV